MLNNAPGEWEKPCLCFVFLLLFDLHTSVLMCAPVLCVLVGIEQLEQNGATGSSLFCLFMILTDSCDVEKHETFKFAICV